MDIQGLAKIIKAAQKGDSQARQALYLESSKSVYFLAFKILKNKEDAEDITQDVFVTVFEKLAELKQPAAYINWVNQITSNKCLNYLKKKKPMLVDEQDLLDIMDEDGSVDNTTPEMLYDNEETRRIIMEIIDKLPETQRVSVMLRYYSQLSIEEIAVATDTNEYTVKNRLATARKKIRSAILDKEEKDGIRLHVLIPIMPVLMRTLEEYEMPNGVQARMWENISTSLMARSKANTSEITQTASGQQLQPVPMSAGEIQNAVLGSAGKGVTSIMTSKAITIILSIIGGAALITGVVIFYPQISEMFSFSNMGEIIADVIGDETTPPIQSEIPNIETSNQQQGQQETDTQSPNGIDLSKGLYEGELDENGLFTGWGVWIYYNLRYEGYFENGIPNGEGTLYGNLGHYVTTTYGHWVDGAAHGEMIHNLTDENWSDTYNFEFVNGTVPDDVQAKSIENNHTLQMETAHFVGIPPWTHCSFLRRSLPPLD